MAELVPPPKSGAAGAGAAGPASDGLPRRFGKYTLLRKLATGGMAELFLAIQRSVAGFEKLIVIKRILPKMNDDKAFIDMLLHEARIAATLSHANVVQTFDVGEIDGTYYIAMEHVHGEDLRSIVRQMRKMNVTEFPFEHAVGILTEVCSGLAYAHEKRDLEGQPLNIVHRDISPQNVVVTFAGDVKIVDFGIAKSDAKMGGDTRSGKLKGKVPYMSPEQARGEVIDARSDIFAVGVILFELTTGKRLFKGQSEFETLKLICERDYPLPSLVKPGYPAELEQIVMRALAKDKNTRFQTAREMQRALEDFVRRERVPVSSVALTHFMQGLFEDTLAAQKEALMQGKQLADIIELQHTRDSAVPPSEVDVTNRPSSGLLSMPAASRTVTGVDAAPARRRGGVWAAAGAFVLLAAAAGGFYSLRHHAAVVAHDQEPPPAPPANRGSLTITTDPPGAAIWLSGDLRPEVTPTTLSELPTSRPVDVRLTMDGYEASKQTVTIPNGAPNARLDVTMNKAPVAEAEPQDVKDTKHGNATTHRPGRGGGGGGAQPTGSGKLNVSAAGGWCNLTIDGVSQGPTPVAGVALSAGPHRVVCTPPDKPSLSATVTVPVDSTARYRFTLQ